MKKIIISLFYLIGILFSLNTFAGTDPIGWSISPSTGFPAATKVGSSYAVTYTMTNNLPFSVPLSINHAYTGGSFSLINGCNKTLASKASCLVHIGFHPTKAGRSTAQITLSYHNNRVPLPQQSSTASSSQTNEKINGQVTSPLPPVTFTGTGYPVSFAFVNNGNTPVTATAVTISGFTATSNQCTTPLNPGAAPCVVSGTFTPAVTGQTTLSVTYVYNNGVASVSVPLTTQSNVQAGGGACNDLTGFTTLPLPTSTLIYANNVVQYKFTNNCDVASATLGTVSFASDVSTAPTITKGTDTCSGQTLAANASCLVYASIVPNATAAEPADLSVTASVPYNSNVAIADATTSEIVNAITSQSSLHTLTFVNQCSQDVWYGFQPVATPDPTPNPSWPAYQMNQQLTGAAPSTVTLQFNAYNGGSIFGRTGCDINPQSPTYGVCSTANCTKLGNSNGQCTTAATQPFTVFEENMNSAAATDGIYDISLINGFNLPGELRSLSPYVPVTATSSFNNTCGNSAGAIIQPAGSALGMCAWTFTTPSTTPGADCSAGTQTNNPSNFYSVPAGPDDACTPGSCSGSNVCGMSWTAQNSTNPMYLGTPITRHCGAFQGYWTLANWTGYSNSQQWGTCNLFNHYSMSTPLDSIRPVGQLTYGYSTLNPNSNPLTAATLADMYSCQPTSSLTCYTLPGIPNMCFNSPINPYYALNSGYDPNITNACGCHDWNNASTTPVSAQTAQAAQCKSFNTLWDQQVYPRILWLKEACPTAYSYQFDDMSSQFACNVANQKTAYQVTYCPGNKSGAPF